MLANQRDTIAAVATPPGRGGVGIVRLSGPQSLAIGEQVCGISLKPRHAHFSEFRDARGLVIDQGVALSFVGPHSFTGEDVVELQGHGGPVILDLLLARLLELGARQARPGEFSERAFLNDKLDLTQAEAIADLIDASSQSAARSALRSLQGDFSREVEGLLLDMTRLRVYVEAAIDFPEEEIDFLADTALHSKIESLILSLKTTLAGAREGALLRDGIKVVLAGRPNAGKSSLLNCLAGRDTAIVTDQAGTTRDILREQLVLDGLPIEIVDTAGLRESTDVVEQEGIKRARSEIDSADLCVLLLDDKKLHKALQPPELSALLSELLGSDRLRERTVVALNKIDLYQSQAGRLTADYPFYAVSASSGAGITELVDEIKTLAGFSGHEGGGFSARRRHTDALQRALQLVEHGYQHLLATSAGELLAEDLRFAQQALGEITGAMSSDDLLGEIFSSFCIGK
ncbi:MAG: tRNA uridine-5-carboxymethylaminomethyl(34) synthesis GTPase MnmE [Porticoccaceae bacterium]